MLGEDSARARRRRLEACDYGRSEGRDVVLAGQVVAQLSEPRFEDMF